PSAASALGDSFVLAMLRTWHDTRTAASRGKPTCRHAALAFAEYMSATFVPPPPAPHSPDLSSEQQHVALLVVRHTLHLLQLTPCVELVRVLHRWLRYGERHSAYTDVCCALEVIAPSWHPSTPRQRAIMLESMVYAFMAPAAEAAPSFATLSALPVVAVLRDGAVARVLCQRVCVPYLRALPPAALLHFLTSPTALDEIAHAARSLLAASGYTASPLASVASLLGDALADGCMQRQQPPSVLHLLVNTITSRSSFAAASDADPMRTIRTTCAFDLLSCTYQTLPAELLRTQVYAGYKAALPTAAVAKDNQFNLDVCIAARDVVMRSTEPIPREPRAEDVTSRAALEVESLALRVAAFVTLATSAKRLQTQYKNLHQLVFVEHDADALRGVPMRRVIANIVSSSCGMLASTPASATFPGSYMHGLPYFHSGRALPKARVRSNDVFVAPLLPDDAAQSVLLLHTQPARMKSLQWWVGPTQTSAQTQPLVNSLLPGVDEVLRPPYVRSARIQDDAASTAASISSLLPAAYRLPPRTAPSAQSGASGHISAGVGLHTASAVHVEPPRVPSAFATSADDASSPFAFEQRVELDWYNTLPSMHALLALIDHVHLTFQQPPSIAGGERIDVAILCTQPMPEWMKALFARMRHPDTGLPLRLFLAKVVINRPRLFEPWQAAWTPCLLTVLLDLADLAVRDVHKIPGVASSTPRVWVCEHASVCVCVCFVVLFVQTAQAAAGEAVCMRTPNSFHYFLLDACMLLCEHWVSVPAALWKPADTASVQLATRFISYLASAAPTVKLAALEMHIGFISVLLGRWADAGVRYDARIVLNEMLVARDTSSSAALSVEGSMVAVAVAVLTTLMECGQPGITHAYVTLARVHSCKRAWIRCLQRYAPSPLA
ncbi:MAG: hypothetical protein EOO41_01195, partial [Methanobacteriota archaeon]